MNFRQMKDYIIVRLSFNIRVNDVAGLSGLYHSSVSVGTTIPEPRAQGREFNLIVFYKKKKTQSLRLANSEANHGSFT